MLLPSRPRRQWSIWTIVPLLIAILITLPLLALLTGSFADTRSVWQHLIETVLAEYVGNSLVLMFAVGVGVTLIGTSTAWLVTIGRFPGRRLFQWALLLPLAAPAYILAYTYTDLLDYYGPIQTSLRGWFGWRNAQEYWFPSVRSLPGAALMLTLVLYPYVYLLARSAFLNQANITLEASRSLGCGPWQGFFKVALPMARPAIAAGASLALMETLNDYGTVEFFAVSTFTTGIFRTWFAQGERLAANQLALLLLGFTLVLVQWEKSSRQRQRYYQKNTRSAPQTQYHLGFWQSVGAIAACSLPIILGFFVPVGVLVSLMSDGEAASTQTNDDDYSATATNARAIGDGIGQFALNSFTLAITAAVVVVVVGLILAYSQRLQPHRLNRLASQVATTGYAIPGAVIAVGAMVPLGTFDNTIDAFMRARFGVSTGLLLSGTIVALIFVYVVRFLAVGYGAIETNLGNISPNLDAAARSLGCNPRQTLWKIHLPLLPSGLITATILVFVDVMKELPATLIMRPQNFDTLAIRVYNLASDERLSEAAAPALAIVVAGLIPVILLSWQMNQPISNRFTSNPPDRQS